MYNKYKAQTALKKIRVKINNIKIAKLTEKKIIIKF